MTSQSFLAAIFAMFAASAAASEPEIIRIGLVRADHAPGCYGAASLEDEAAVYAQHLESRFSSAVELCFSSDGTWEAGEPLDLAWGAREMLASLEDGFRPILTARRPDGLGRVPMVFFTVSDHSGRSMADIGQNSLAVNTRDPLPINVDMPLEVLSDFGIVRDTVELVETPGPEDTVAAVRSGAAMFGALEVSSWARTCNVYVQDQVGCDDMHVIANVRPRAEEGMVIRNDASKELRYRMIGVHAYLHLQSPESFRWLVGDDAPELEPTEAEAFQIGRLAQQ